MATILLRAAGAAIGTAIGGPIGGAIGGGIGAIAGAVVDSALINVLFPRREANLAQAAAIQITNAAENAGMRQLWGRMRLGGNVIWCTRFNSYTTTTGGGKGFGGSSTKTTTVSYTLSFAVAFCEGGPETSFGRIWADGNLLDLSKYTIRYYRGTEDQVADSLIETVEGTGNAPSYRGVCYIVFDTMVLDDFGGRMPQITAEIIRRPDVTDPDDIGNLLRGVAMLPGAGEFVLGTTIYKASDGYGNWNAQNANTQNLDVSDFFVSLDRLVGVDPDFTNGALANPSAVSLVVSWYGTDLRAGNCQILPGVETRSKTTTPASWGVASYNRGSAHLVSQIDASLLDPGSPPGNLVPAFGGTPSDATVTEAIVEMKRRGLRVMFYPFVMMDIAAGNGLPDPYGGAEQAAFPWRGRVTCHPAPGQPGTVDKTATAATQVNAFFTAYTAMATHYASLCASAGGVDAFIIGSELVGLTRVRSTPGDGTFPAVQALKTLAASIRAIVGSSCKIGYAADWSEYHSYRPADGTNDVIFNLDPLWSDSNIDFVGIDNYLPLSDWRDGSPNADFNDATGPRSIYDKAYLQANIEGGEDYAWYYASDADRVAQTRTTIADAAYSKPWVFRNKDIRNWWANAHKSRPGGVENAGATAWSAASKPVWFTEFGCPAVDKGTNQPNVFYDPKSAESSLPYFSQGSKDDAIQRAYLEATLTYWRDNAPTVSGVKLVDPINMFAWAWDARPYPEFPAMAGVWRDGVNYELGHWLPGRLEEVPVKWIVEELCAASGLADYDASGVVGPGSLCPGYATEGVISARDALAGMQDALMFDGWETGGNVVFVSREYVRVASFDWSQFTISGPDDQGYTLTRLQETDLPDAVKLSFVDPYKAYSPGEVEARKDVGSSNVVSTVSTSAVLDQAYASGAAKSILQQAWAARETAQFGLPPSKLYLDAGDGMNVTIDGVTISLRAQKVTLGVNPAIEAQGFDPSLLAVAVAPQARNGSASTSTRGPPVVELLDLPLITGAETLPWAPYVAAYASPWYGVDVYRSNGTGFDFVVNAPSPCAMGETTTTLGVGPVDRWDDGNTVDVQFYGAAGLISLSDASVLSGLNTVAIKNAGGGWEVVQFANATLLSTNKYRLSRLLRGQLGTEGAMDNPFAVGSRVVVLTGAPLVALTMTSDMRGISQTLRYGPAGAPQSDADYAQASYVFLGIGLRPYSVSLIQGARTYGSNDVAFTWLRRTRFAGDGWDAADAPLNEQSESYDLEVTSGGVVKRTVYALPSSAWTYLAADQVTDFGSAQASYTVNVYQNSATFGRGQVATQQVSL